MQPLKLLIMGALYQSLGEKDTAMQVSEIKLICFMCISECLLKILKLQFLLNSIILLQYYISERYYYFLQHHDVKTRGTQKIIQIKNHSNKKVLVS